VHVPDALLNWIPNKTGASLDKVSKLSQHSAIIGRVVARHVSNLYKIDEHEASTRNADINYPTLDTNSGNNFEKGLTQMHIVMSIVSQGACPTT
jgi:hypothetical protein